MSVSPEPELIVVNTPPDSPEGSFTTLQPSHPFPDNDFSPQKRTRKPLARQRKRRRTEHTPEFVQRSCPSSEINVEGPAATHSIHGAEAEDSDPPKDVGEVDSDSENELEVVTNDENDYSTAVLDKRAGFYPITRELFVVQGWDKKQSSITDSWFHLQRSEIGQGTYYGCTCPRDWFREPCVHELFLTSHWEKFSYLGEAEWDEMDGRIVMFSRQSTTDSHSEVIVTSIFTVAGHTDNLNSRAFVTHTGTSSGDGSWKCTKDRNQPTCRHIDIACDHLQKLIQGNPNATDTNHPLPWAPLPLKNFVEGADKGVSYLPILPPHWASLDTDPILYARPEPVVMPPMLLYLDTNSNSSCSCRAKFDPSRPILTQPCTIYTLTKALPSTIQIQPCPTCPAAHRHYIGPDCRELGIFNLNNNKLFTHELLDEYTSAYTLSETPFVAWASILSRRYNTHHSEPPFVSVDVFRNAWFAFSLLQDFSNDMRCPKCGPSPEDIIWDGVTLAFNKKHILTSLRPPTTSDNNSVIRPHVQYYPHQQLIPHASLRVLLRKAMCGPKLQDLINDQVEPHIQAAAASTGLSFITLLEQVETLLRAENHGAAEIFVQHFGAGKQIQNYVAPNPFRHLFIQLAAEESVLQLANRAALYDLYCFIASPTPTNASRLVSIPAIHDILKLEQIKDGEKYQPSTLSLCWWIYNRGRTVLQTLQSRTATPLESRLGSYDEDWRSTGCFYSMPQIRSRPIYPKLAHDQKNDSGGNRGAKCSKYFLKYGKNELTGGIMGAWCTHSICYGFHCIPYGEGRNDVFSAMVTRWPKPPKRVIYDFACALGPYCLLREPEFFGDTLFVVDNFHAKGHTKCAPAAFLSSYSRLDPRLVDLNSSAAECGNGGLTRIRKSVSYMSQVHAMQYTRVFIAIWNRNKIRRMTRNKK